TQLSLGDESAMVSLKSLIPDRGETYGMLSFDLDGRAVPPDDGGHVEPLENAPKIATLLQESAAAATLRRLQTLHVLATETVKNWVYDSGESDFSTDGLNRSQRWLAAIEKSNVNEVEDADKLGWVAYAAGDYAAAESWLDHVKTASAHSDWLRAKLLRRAGKLKAATEAMKAAVAALEALPKAVEGEEYEWTEQKTLLNDAYADLAVLHFSQDEYLEALDAFHEGGLGEDWAYVAERMLSADELKQWVDQHFPLNASKNNAEADNPSGGQSVRHVVARRLVREDRYADARAYMPPDAQPILDRYVKYIGDGANEKLAKKVRARAWFDAAALLKENGDLLMATEGEPDEVGRWDTAMALEREKGQLLARGENSQFVPPEEPRVLKFYVPVSAEEKKRLAQHQIVPFRPGHYRYIALALAWKSAALLPDQSDELADVLNTAGNWIKGDYRGDDVAAGKFFQAIERRASKTALGREAGKSHWFVPRYGPWSKPPVTE
ncbi:MAG: hypothetical protein KDK97_14670, partial [Verrucomicrobiales bacterium]|nr:hypothetical protein [Verrucomicrobiales bacterium]